eukprot:11763245-Karenia_brevis.AAC.1
MHHSRSLADIAAPAYNHGHRCQQMAGTSRAAMLTRLAAPTRIELENDGPSIVRLSQWACTNHVCQLE